MREKGKRKRCLLQAVVTHYYFWQSQKVSGSPEGLSEGACRALLQSTLRALPIYVATSPRSSPDGISDGPAGSRSPQGRIRHKNMASPL